MVPVLHAWTTNKTPNVIMSFEATSLSTGKTHKIYELENC
jgi:hypothetical protein